MANIVTVDQTVPALTADLGASSPAENQALQNALIAAGISTGGGGGGGVGTLQQVTTAGNTTSNPISFTGSGGPAGAPVTIGRQSNGALSNWLELNGIAGVINNGPGAQGVAPVPSLADIADIGASGLRWNTMYTNRINMSGDLVWSTYTIPAPTGSTTQFLRNDGSWAVPAGGGGGGAGTVTSVTVNGTAGNLTSAGGPVTTSGTITLNLAATAVTPGAYTNANVTVDSFGRVTSASSGSARTLQQVTTAGNTTSNPISFTQSGGNAYVSAVPSQTYLDVNGAFWAVRNVNGNGIVPPTDNTNFCGGIANGWAAVYTYNTLTPSDVRLKINIQDSALGLEFINKLRPVSYNWKNTTAPTEVQYGLIAQEVEELPESTNFAGLSYSAADDRYSLAYTQFIAPMIKAIQELTSKNTQLEASLAVLIARVTALELK